MFNCLPQVLNLQNPGAGDSYYCVFIEPANAQPIEIFTFAYNQYQAIENAWKILSFCDLASPIQVRRLN